MFSDLGIRPRQQPDMGREVSRAGEQLLAVDDVVVPVNYRACLESRKVGPCAGLGVAERALDLAA